MKILRYLIPFVTGIALMACHDDEKLSPSDESLFPDQRQTPLDDSLRKLFGPYNTVIEYRYVENYLPNDWYSITPVLEDKVWPAMKFMKSLWVDALVAGSSEEFVQAHFPRMLVLVGSPAYQKNGTEVLGEAEGGTLVRFTRLNDFNPDSRSWAIKQLTTAFHEYAHIMHQMFRLPDEYRNVTPNSYTMNGWLVITEDEAISLGMATPYATSAVTEDFAELFAQYVLLDDDAWETLYYDQPDTGESGELSETEKNKGRVFIRKKFEILKKFLLENGLNIEKVRADAQKKLETLK